MKLEVRAEVLEVVVIGQLVGDIHAECDSSLVGPTPVVTIIEGLNPATSTGKDKKSKITFADLTQFRGK